MLGTGQIQPVQASLALENRHLPVRIRYNIGVCLDGQNRKGFGPFRRPWPPDAGKIKPIAAGEREAVHLAKAPEDELRRRNEAPVFGNRAAFGAYECVWMSSRSAGLQTPGQFHHFRVALVSPYDGAASFRRLIRIICDDDHART